MKSFDYIIIGTGQATGTLLGKLTQTGESIAVIEANKIGGSCVNYGCTPTKTLVASAKAIHQARRGDEFGFTGHPEVNFNKIMQRMNEVRGSSHQGISEWIKSEENVTLINGAGSFVDKKTLEVNGETISGNKIFINVGTRPSAPPIKGIETVDWMDSAKLLELSKLPEHLIIIGGGYIGVEFAQVFKRFGSKITLIQRNDQLMPLEDRDVADSVLQVLLNEGVDVHLNTNTIKVTQTETMEVSIESDGKTELLSCSHLLIAAGRQPNTDTLKTDAAGIKTDKRGYIKVNDYCETNVEGVFAVGDVNGHGAFTHTSVNDGEIVLDYLFDGDRKLSDRSVIYGLFTDPPLGRVGLSEKAAIEKGYKILRGTMLMSNISRAKEMGETDGMVKVIVDAETDLLLGAAIHGLTGDEVINVLAMLMHSGVTYREFRKIVLPHPTVSELIPYVFDELKPVN